MKKIAFILILILFIIYITLSVISSNAEYMAEKLFYKALKINSKIMANPDVVPPGMVASVENNLLKILEKYPKTETGKVTHMALAEFYVANGEYDKALKEIYSVIAMFQGKPIVLSKALSLKGNIFERQGNWNEALKVYKKLRNEYPNTTFGIQIPIYIGNYYKRSDQDTESQAAYSEAVIFYKSLERVNQRKEVGFVAMQLLIQCYMNLDRYEEAGDAMVYAIDEYPNEMTYAQQVSNIENVFIVKLGDKSRAMEAYNKIKEGTKNERLKSAIDEKVSTLKSTQ